MIIKLSITGKSMRIESEQKKIEFQIDYNEIRLYEFDKDSFRFIFPDDIKEKSDNFVSELRKNLSLLKKILTSFRANEIDVYMGKEYQEDLIIRSLYDFCTSILIGRVIKIMDTDDNKDLLKPKHIMDIENLRKRYKRTKDRDYLLEGMEVQ